MIKPIGRYSPRNISNFQFIYTRKKLFSNGVGGTSLFNEIIAGHCSITLRILFKFGTLVNDSIYNKMEGSCIACWMCWRLWASGSSVQSKVIDMVIVEVQNGPLVLVGAF